MGGLRLPTISLIVHSCAQVYTFVARVGLREKGQGVLCQGGES